MELLNSVALILSSLWIGGTSELQLCQFGQTTTHQTNIDMNSTAISGSFSMCSCRIQLNNEAKISMFPDLNIPGCRTRVSVSDSPFDFPCLNEKIFSPYHADKKAGDVLWLFVKTTEKSLPMSGNLQVKTTKTEIHQQQQRLRQHQIQHMKYINQCHQRHQMQMFHHLRVCLFQDQDQLLLMFLLLLITREGSKPKQQHKLQFHQSPQDNWRQNAPHDHRMQETTAIAGGIAGSVAVLVIIVIGCVIFHRRYRCIRRTESDQIPESRDHPTYCDLTNRENTEYEHIVNTKKMINQNGALDISE